MSPPKKTQSSSAKPQRAKKKAPKSTKSTAAKTAAKKKAQPSKKVTARPKKKVITKKAAATNKGGSKKPVPAKPKAASVKKAQPAKKTKKKLVSAGKKAKSTPVKKEKKATTKKASPATKKVPAKALKKTVVKKEPKTLVKESKSTVTKPAPSVNEEATKAIVLGARKRTSTPSIFKIRSRRNTPILFTLEDVHHILDERKKNQNNDPKIVAPAIPPSIHKAAKKAVLDAIAMPSGNQKHAPASVMDILGYNPSKSKGLTPFEEEAAKIPSKFKKFYKLLVELREHIKKELDMHAQDTLKRSSKDDSGDLSGYSQHMADVGTENFDREFALGLLSNEQDALYEIEEAIGRMIDGSYGVCEVTGKPISKERLEAVPFTRCSLEGQKELEKNRRRVVQRGGIFSETFDSEGPTFADEDVED